MFNMHDCYTTYINMDHRVDRRTAVEKTLQANDIIATRTRGLRWQECVDMRGHGSGRRRVTIHIPPVLHNMYNQSRGPGNIGCYFAHLACLTQALVASKNAFIMEDDLVICSDFAKRVNIITEFLNTNQWDIFWLSSMFHTNPPYWHHPQHPHMSNCMCTMHKDVIPTNNPRIVQTYGAFTTTAYFVNLDSIKQIIELLNKHMAESYAIDHAFIRIQPQLRTYAFVPGCIKQYNDHSDISNNWAAQGDISKLGPYVYQNKMEEFEPSTFKWD